MSRASRKKKYHILQTQPQLERMPTVARAQEELNVIGHYWPPACNYKRYCSIPQEQRKVLSLQTKQLQRPAHSNPVTERQASRGRPLAEGLPAAKGQRAAGSASPRDGFHTPGSASPGHEGLTAARQPRASARIG